MNYTKGEWKAICNDLEGLIIFADKSKIAKPYYFQGIKTNGEFLANAYLIAAAPDMYEALKLIASCKSSVAGDVVDIARKALAKAEGR